jgi:hypothetical protein
MTIIVNTCDAFEDCWQPFFSLFARYWPEYRAPVLLNTEKKTWSTPLVDVTCTQVGTGAENGTRKPWSDCLIQALDQVQTPLVLYLQEDYFVQDKVDTESIETLSQIMLLNPEIKHIGLTHFGSVGPFEPTSDPRLWRISRKSRYRISTQAGLWRVEALKSYLVPGESGWMFEILGTIRSRRRNEEFLTVSRDYFGPRQRIVDYVHTGIVKGKWHPEIPTVFEKHALKMDFAKRGFYKQPAWLVRKFETGKTLLANPRLVLKTLLG